MRQPREHSVGDQVLVSFSRSKPPKVATVTDVRKSSVWGCLQYRVEGDSYWHNEGNVRRVED